MFTDRLVNRTKRSLTSSTSSVQNEVDGGKEAENVTSGHRKKRNARFSPSKGTASSFSDYELHLFTQLLDRVYHKGHNGFTHSQCTSLQSNVGGTLYNNNNNDDDKKRRLFLKKFFHLPNAQRGDEGSRGNISESEKPERTVVHLYFLFRPKEATFLLCSVGWEKSSLKD